MKKTLLPNLLLIDSPQTGSKLLPFISGRISVWLSPLKALLNQRVAQLTCRLHRAVSAPEFLFKNIHPNISTIRDSNPQYRRMLQNEMSQINHIVEENCPALFSQFMSPSSTGRIFVGPGDRYNRPKEYGWFDGWCS